MADRAAAAGFVAAGVAAARAVLRAAEQPGQVAAVAEAADLVADTLRGGGRLLVVGNGGSAADAAHLVAEFVGRCSRERDPLPAVALAENAATVTALANDYGYEQVFARQVRALARPGDLLIVLSTSGRSANVLAALDAARSVGCATLGLTGADGGAMAGRCDLLLRAPSVDTPRVQEVHHVWCHLLAQWSEQVLFG